MEQEYKIILYGTPITKKNSLNLIGVGKKCPVCNQAKKHIPLPSKQYKDYEKKCMDALRGHKNTLPSGIDYPVNIKMVYYMPTKRKVDLTNLQNATLDMLVACCILEDDNSRIVYSTDGSKVLYDKENPRVEIEITPISKAELSGDGFSL